jgi:hypothetical protein
MIWMRRRRLPLILWCAKMALWWRTYPIITLEQCGGCGGSVRGKHRCEQPSCHIGSLWWVYDCNLQQMTMITSHPPPHLPPPANDEAEHIIFGATTSVIFGRLSQESQDLPISTPIASGWTWGSCALLPACTNAMQRQTWFGHLPPAIRINNNKCNGLKKKQKAKSKRKES